MWRTWSGGNGWSLTRSAGGRGRRGRGGGRDRVGAVGRRRRRRLVAWLRRTAQRVGVPSGPARPHCLLMLDRVAAVRGDLLELAELLEAAADPEPRTVAALERLLGDGCDSPLYNRAVHPSELRATLFYARRALAGDQAAARSVSRSASIPE